MARKCSSGQASGDRSGEGQGSRTMGTGAGVG